MRLQRNVLEYLEATAARLPDKAAFVDEGGEVTFAALLDGARAIGSALCVAAPGGRPVAVLTDRTAISITGFLGALQAGCCYVPIDNKMPQERMRSILTQLRPAALLYAARDAATAHAVGDGIPLLELESAMRTEINAAALSERRAHVLDIDPAYIIFTSGSTGTPKGILISHRSVIDFVEWFTESCELSERDVLGNQAPFYFDLSVKDLYTTLSCGATTHILPRKFFSFPKLLTAYLREHQVTTLIWATSAFRLVANSGILEKDAPTTVTKVILGGEALQATHLNRWRQALPQTNYINLYGPTEVTVDCTWFPITREYADDEIIPIGKACRNMEVLLLDDDLRPVPSGEAGEICVRGIGLALGYFGDWEKTNAAFVQNPNNPDYPDRIYRTGDLARMDADGNLVFLARKDDQIKHMGYRIELGEVETALSAIPGVEAVACIFDKAADQIVCFCQSKVSVDELASEAKRRLPRYMAPNVWRIAARLPLNANGKLDRVKLRNAYVEENQSL
jgi:amino acid adenylation domain-containing protein